MADKKSVELMRREIRGRIISALPLSASKMTRSDIQYFNTVLDKWEEVRNSIPRPADKEAGRPASREIPGKEEEGFIVPQKPEGYREKKKKEQKVEVPMFDMDSGTGSESEEEVKQAKKADKVVKKAEVVKTEPKTEKPKKTLSDEQKAKMKAGREAKKAGVKKDTPPPEAPKKEEPKSKATERSDGSEEPKAKKLPVFKIGF